MRKRIFISFIALIIVFGGLSSALVASIMSSVIPQQVMNRLRSESDLLIKRMKDKGAEAAFGQLLSTSRVTYIAQDGTVLFDSEGRGDMDNRRPGEVRQAADSGSGSAVRYSQTLKANLIYVATRRRTAAFCAWRRRSGQALRWRAACCPGRFAPSPHPLEPALAAFLTSRLVKPFCAST